MSRSIERSIARTLYAKFSKKWRHEKRLGGVYGEPGYKRPSFSEWYSIHQKDADMMKKSTPSDVAEYLEIGADDPWSQPYETHAPVIAIEERGVTTINIAGNEDD